MIFNWVFLSGWGAVFNTVKMEPGKSIAVFGLGALGLSVIQAAKKAGANDIVGVDINDAKYEIAKVKDCVLIFIYFSKYVFIETHAPAFLPLNISAVGSVL